MVDQLESLKDAPIDVITASLDLESDTGDDAIQWIRELRLSSSQLKIPVYLETLLHKRRHPRTGPLQDYPILKQSCKDVAVTDSVPVAATRDPGRPLPRLRYLASRNFTTPENLHPELPGPEERIVDFPKGKVGVYTKFFEFANFRLPLSQFLFDILGHYQIHLSQLSVIGAAKVFPTVAYWRTSAPKGEMPAKDTYSADAVTILNTHRTPIQKQPGALLCLVGLNQRYFLRDDVYPTFLHDDDRDMDLFNLIRAPNPTKVKTGTRPHAAHEVPLLTGTASRVIEMEDLATTIDSSGVPSTIERSPLDFANENPSQQSTWGNGTEDQGLAEEIAVMGPRVIKEHRKRGNDGGRHGCTLKVLRRDHADSRPTQSTIRGKSFTAIGLGMGSTFLYLLRRIRLYISSKGTTVSGDPKSEHTSFTSMVGSPESIYQPEWGMTNACRLDAPKACQELVDHLAPPGYFSELHHLHNDDFLKQYNINLARQVAMGSQLRLRFEQDAKLLKKFVAQVARRDQRIQARENEIKNLEALLEAETDMKKTAEAKNTELGKELENLHALFLDLRVSNDPLSQQMSTLQAQVTGEEKLKAAFEEFKQYEDNRVKKHSIASRRWVIGHRLCLAVMKCDESTELKRVFADVVSAGIANGMSEGLKYGVEHEKANLDLEAIEAYDRMPILNMLRPFML
nr:transposase (putative), gypsy type [Tanacetum cinerariifolium]